MTVCKEGPAGTYQFTAVLTPSNLIYGPNGVTPILFHDAADGTVDGRATFTIDAGSCLYIALGGGPAPTFRRTITITEAAHAGTEFVSATVSQLSGSNVTTTTVGNPASGLIDGTEGAVIVFKNQVEPQGSISILKTAAAATVDAGSDIGFSIQVSSNGPGVAKSVVLTDTLPTGTGISWTIANGAAGCAISNNVLSCSFGDMAASTSKTVSVQSATTGASCATYSNTARASATGLATVQSSASTTVRCPSLSIDKTSDAAVVNAGSNIGFTITVSSNGPGTATGVTLSDALPTGTGISWSMSPSTSGCSIQNNVLSCDFGDLASGQTRSVHVTSATTTGSCSIYSNTASASATNHATVQASASTTVLCPQVAFNGCTPGFWKQSQHFAFWTSPFTQGTQVKSVFSGTVGYITDKGKKPMGDQTLLDALNFQGGSSIGGAAEILLRAATSAVLNAANPNVNYTRTVSDIVTSVNAALATGSRDSILALATALDKDNNRGECTAKVKLK